VSTADIVGFLSDAAAYGEPPGSVEVKETTKSWVFLTATDVYKLKKPIRNHFQDLSTIATREDNTRREIALNRRLAPDVYLGAVPLTLDARGELAVDGEGPVVDWLVRMRRLPEDRMLEEIILRGEATETRIGPLLKTLAGQLIDFYTTVPRADFAPDEYAALFEREQAENRKVLTNKSFLFDQDWLDGLLSGFDKALAANRGLLEDRVRMGRVVEGHGDLRPEHVCLVDPPVVIDCLEFSQRLRFVDPFDELSYLGLECHTIGAAWIKDFLIGRIAAGLDDRPADNVLLFYEAYRAFLRARQSLAHLLVPNPREPAKWMPKARGYLEIAERALLTLAT
jgi:aminoglycoside phosphotransferase family enzyme